LNSPSVSIWLGSIELLFASAETRNSSKELDFHLRNRL
jgi:hypothetical protein